MARPETRFLTEAEYDEWNRLVAVSSQGSIYAMTDYLDLLCRTGGGSFRVLGAFRGQELVGGIALYERRRGTGTFVAPRLLLYYNGVVVRDWDTKYPSVRTARELAVVSALEAALRGAGYARMVLKSRATLTDVRPFLAAGWSVTPSYTYVVRLTDLMAQWGRVERNLRRLVERCAEQGLTVTDDADFESFYRMHLATHERKGAPVYMPRDRFAEFVKTLRARGWAKLYHARLPTGESISAQLVLLGPHPVTHTVAAAQDAEHRSLGATPFLRWEVFARLAAAGFAANDLTDAALNPVTHFKSQFGGQLQTSFVLARTDSVRFRARLIGRRMAKAAARRVRRAARRIRPGQGS